MLTGAFSLEINQLQSSKSIILFNVCLQKNGNLEQYALMYWQLVKYVTKNRQTQFCSQVLNLPMSTPADTTMSAFDTRHKEKKKFAKLKLGEK